ncbi:MAG: M81 family metallopeptidase [Ilumatobacteraceae bacterium]|nr:M81 family metallopeptidase [Ilumatobacteraceae bacterium]
MRIGLIQVTQETSSFNPTLTTLADFESFGIYEGAEILERQESAGLVGGYLEGIRQSGVEVETVPIVRGAARSGGRLATEVFDFFDGKVRDGLAVAGQLDGLVMLLHGAASAEGNDDVEGALLRTARDVVGPELPLGLMLDHHANVTQAMIDHADVIVGFRTQPHDQFETARDLTKHAVRLFAGEIAPTTAWRNLRMMTHQEQYLTSRGPMKILFDRAREMEQDPRAVAVSPFPMQCWLDAEEGGWSMVVVTDDDQELAEQFADELADLAWPMRHRFQETESRPVDRAVADADAAETGLVILSDTGDSVLGGSGGDSTVLLESILRVGITNRALIPMIDPVSAPQLAAAGVGATVTLELGGRSAPFFTPLEVTGVVRAVSDGIVELSDHAETEIDMGHTVAFEVGPVTLLVSEYAGVAGIHPDVYRHVGIEPTEYHMMVMKTASNFQYMAPFTSTIIRAATPGPTQSDIAALPWERIPRPCFPMEAIESWRG